MGTLNIGSQIRIDSETGEQTRQWLSLAEYYQAFGEFFPKYSNDFREEPCTCRWCGAPLEGHSKHYCSEECRDNYSWRVVQRKTLPPIPHRIALRDNFTCVYCNKDLASVNKHGVRLPVSAGDVSCDHLIPVARGGTDHVSNLVCACKGCNFKKGVLTVDEFYDMIEQESGGKTIDAN